MNLTMVGNKGSKIVIKRHKYVFFCYGNINLVWVQMLSLPLQELHEALILGHVESTVILYTFEQALMRVDLNINILKVSIEILHT